MFYLLLCVIISSMIDAMDRSSSALPIKIVEWDMHPGAADLTVIGLQEQRALSLTDPYDDDYIGKITYFPQREIRFSAIKPAQFKHVIAVCEPELMYDIKGYTYHAIRMHTARLWEADVLEKVAYEGKQAVEEAEKDLYQCYSTILSNAHEYFTSEHKKRTIALPLLSIMLGFPLEKVTKIAVSALYDFIQMNKYKYQYSLIKLFVHNLHMFEEHVAAFMNAHDLGFESYF